MTKRMSTVVEAAMMAIEHMPEDHLDKATGLENVGRKSKPP
jgi:hypothetical protein